MPLTIHHLENSQSLRVVWLLEELGADYEIKLYKRTEDKLAPPELKAISPLGTSPCLTDDGGVALSETNAIIEYILDKTGDTTYRPVIGNPDRNDYLFFFHGAQGSLGPTVTQDFVWKLVVSQVPCPINSIFKIVYGKLKESFLDPRLNTFLQVCEDKLKGRDYIASSTTLTAADIVLIFPMEEALDGDETLKTKYPKCEAWKLRMYKRDAHKRAMSKVGETEGGRG